MPWPRVTAAWCGSCAIAVPGAVGLAMAAVVGISVFNPFRMLMPKLPLDMGNLVVSGTKITMEAPHLAGYTPDRRPYEMWAKTAMQDVTDPDHVELNKLRTKLLMQDGSTVFLDSLTGLFDNKAQTLDLHKDIFLQTTTGYEARLTQAHVDMVKNTVDSDEHVDVKLTNGTLSSDRLRIINGGEIIRFEGNVVMNLDHLNTDDGSQAAPEPAPPREDEIEQQIRQLEMSPMTQFFRCGLEPRAGRAIAAALSACVGGVRGARAEHGVECAQCDAGFHAKSRSADPDRSRLARDARQGKGSDLLRQCEGGAGRHHHDVEDAGGVLRVRAADRARQRRRRPPMPGQHAKAGAKSAGAPMQSATPGPGGASSIKRLEARGNVVVVQKDQVVTGEKAVFDTKANLITMLGGGQVVLTQCKNVLRGDRLMVDMTTGVSRVESDSGRVQALLPQGGGGDCGPAKPGGGSPLPARTPDKPK